MSPFSNFMVPFLTPTWGVEGKAKIWVLLVLGHLSGIFSIISFVSTFSSSIMIFSLYIYIFSTETAFSLSTLYSFILKMYYPLLVVFGSYECLIA